MLGGRPVSALGLGTAGLSVADRPTDEQGRAVVRAAYERGIALFDTATCYVPSELDQGHGEALIAAGLREAGANRDEVVIASKAGIERIASVDFATDFRTDGHPDTIRRHCEQSLRFLDTDRIDLYQLHSPDPNVPLAETMGAFAELREEGKIDLVGVCNVTVEQLDEALSAAPIACVQNAFSPTRLDSLDLIARCEEKGIAFLAYSPLGGLGARARDLPDRHPEFAELASARGVSPQRVALAWELATSPVVVPLVGARRRETLEDSLGALGLDLSHEELRRLAV